MYSVAEKEQMQSLGLRIAEARQRAELRQEDLALKTETTQRQISRYERGLSSPPLVTLRAMSDALNVSVDWLLGRTDDPRGMHVRESDEWTAEVLEGARLVNELSAEDQRMVLGIIVFTVNELRLRARKK